MERVNSGRYTLVISHPQYIERRIVLQIPTEADLEIEVQPPPLYHETVTVTAAPWAVDRGDGGGMHILELKIWKESGLNPQGEDWYEASGQFMLPSLLHADRHGQYHMLDSSTWILHKSRVRGLKLSVKGPADVQARTDPQSRPFSIGSRHRMARSRRHACNYGCSGKPSGKSAYSSRQPLNSSL